MTKCPHCFMTLSGELAAFTCQGSCGRVRDTQFTELHGAEQMSRTLTVVERPVDDKGRAQRRWKVPAEVGCHACGSRAIEVCVNCHFVLPEGWRQGEAVCIALAGPRQTGKSVYIGVVVKELTRMIQALGAQVSPVGGTAAHYANWYETPLYRAREMLAPTAAAHVGESPHRWPLIFSVGRPRGAKAQQFLVLRDVAGEDLQNRASGRNFEFFRHADLVVFLFDPTQVQEVTNELTGRPVPINTVGADPSGVLDHVLNLMRGGRAALALAVAKFDTLQILGRPVAGSNGGTGGSTAWSLRLAHAGAVFNREPQEEPAAYDEADGALLNQEVRSLLMAMHARGIVNAVENPNDGRRIQHRFFVVSALGAPPRIQGQHARGIAPYRVLDPIRWAFARAGVIGVAK